MKTCILFLAACLAAAAGNSAGAAQLVIGGVTGLENVNGNGAGAVNGPSTTVTGDVSNTPSFLLDITTSEDLLFGSGSAIVTDNDDKQSVDYGFGVDGVTFNANPGTPFLFSAIDMNISALADTALSILVTFSDATTQLFALGLDSNGQNRFAITADGSELFASVTVTTASGNYIENIKQIQIGGAVDPDDIPPVPEPTSLTLLGIGALGMAAMARRKARSA